MYPRISDILNDLFNTDWFLLPIQSFGFFVALCFIAAYFALAYDLKLKQIAGIFSTKPTKVKKGGPVPEVEILTNFVLLGVLGFKLGLMFEDYSAFASNPQEAILSSEGSFLWALIFAFVGGGFKLYEYIKAKDQEISYEKEDHGIIEELGTIFTIAFIGGILGAKVFHNLEYWDNFIENPIKALLSFDGLTFYGGLIVAAAGIIYYVKKKKYPLLPFADSVAPVLMLGYGVGRIGCQVAGDGDWGIENTAPKPGWLSWAPDWAWSYNYPHNVLNSGVPIDGCTGDYCNALATPVYPTPFYEVLMALTIFAGLWLIRKRLPYWGQLMGIYLMFNGLERFFIEKIRVNANYIIFGSEITQAEIISTVLFLGGVVLFSYATFKWKKPYIDTYRNPVKKTSNEGGEKRI